MAKYIILTILLINIFILHAEGSESPRRSDPSYKNLKIQAKVIQRYAKSNYYQMQVDIVNTGNKSVSFWEDVNIHIWTFRLWAGGVGLVSKRECECFEKRILYKPYEDEVLRKVRIFPHQKYRLYLYFQIGDREVFLNSNKNLRLIFHFYDANLNWKEDPTRPKIESNILAYKW